MNKLQELKKLHDADLKELYKKYNINEFEILLDELEDVNNQIKELNNGKDANIDSVEQDIEKYINDIDYYSCILEDCRYRKPAEAVTTFNCNLKN
ncbi:hypothetical protein NQ314_001702 [Rhamnusium bicolor]|uniref:Uncharacterized protein n=1 Tax=Rhamnusium bicolor TaxID=1586634 RepID=A0AAV8ZRN8_9CUCU|nr:hypothetical protein NQ314_001702 [Rhamnusium bicolor]